MIISSIEKYKGSTYCVIFADDSRIYLNKEIISDFNLKAGSNIPQEAISEITYASDFRRARERALYLLEARSYSFAELCEKLQKNYSYEISLEVTTLMAKRGYINDEDYARQLARNYIEVKKYGYYKAKSELLRKGIEKELAEDILAEYEDDTIERLISLIEKKYTRYLGDEKGRIKVKNALSRQGYSYSDISSVMDEFSEYFDD